MANSLQWPLSSVYDMVIVEKVQLSLKPLGMEILTLLTQATA